MGNKNTEAIERYRKKHNIVEIRIHIAKEEKEKLTAYAQNKGMSLTGYIKELINTGMNSGFSEKR